MIFFSNQNEISIETMKNIQNRCDMSNNELIDVAKSLRLDNVKIEPGLKEELFDSDAFLKEFFEVREMEMEVKVDNEIVTQMKHVVLCKDVNAFCEDVMKRRGVKNKVTVKYGADGGG